MQRDIERQAFRLPAQQPRRQIEVRRAADRQELRQALHNRQHNHLIDRHVRAKRNGT